MPKIVEIKKICGRCGRTIPKEKESWFPFSFTGFYPLSWKRIDGKKCCNECQTELHEVFMKNAKKNITLVQAK